MHAAPGRSSWGPIALLDTSAKPCDRAFLAVAVDTAARAGEITGLHVGDVDLAGGNLLIGHGSLPLLDADPGPVPLPGGAEVDLLAPHAPDRGAPVRSVAGPPAPAGDARLLPGRARPADPLRLRRRGVAADRLPDRFGLTPGSAEMPSAGCGFTAELVAELIGAGVGFAPITLHTGVSSLEASDPPYPERFAVPAASAELVNQTRAAGRRVVAVGTTATRAIEGAADDRGRIHPSQGWTDLVIGPDRGVRVTDGILTGWHEPEASHLLLLEAVAGLPLLERSYERALAGEHRWHEFGDFHLVLP